MSKIYYILLSLLHHCSIFQLCASQSFGHTFQHLAPVRIDDFVLCRYITSLERLLYLSFSTSHRPLVVVDAMTMTMEQGRSFGAMGFDQFSDPWGSTSSANSMSQLYPTTLGSSNSIGFDALAKQQAARANTNSISYNSIAASAPSIAANGGYHTSAYPQSGAMSLSHEIVNPSRTTYSQAYSAAPNPSMNAYSSTSNMFLGPFGNLTQQSQQDLSRRLSQQ